MTAYPTIRSILGKENTRRKIVVGNWKMCGTYDRVRELDAIAAAARQHPLDVVICPPFPLIPAALRHGPAVMIGAQDCHHELEGAYTGSTSPALLREIGATHVIVGHSERRAAYAETSAMVCAKTAAAIRAGLVAIICVGESAAERAAGATEAVITEQIEGSIPATARPEEILIAYEPIWAIGSGATPTPLEVADVHGSIRGTLRRTLGAGQGDAMRLLYGGSVSPANVDRLIRTPGVDGLLVGTSSLSAREFVPIIEAAARAGEANRPARTEAAA
jgi:triosephosphate isomerase